MNEHRTAFVLSGGASLGAIQVGMLQALYEREIAPDLILGTSVGALNGAFIASRPQTTATADALAEVWLGLSRGKVFPLNPVTGFVGFFGRSNHLIPDRHLRRIVDSYLEIERLEDATVPLHVIATDVISSEEVRLSRGDALEAVMASAAIPGVFPPVEWGERDLVDGGISNNAPISHALELGAERVYVLPTGYACALDEPPRGALAMLLHSTSLLLQRRLVLEIELLKDQAELIVLPPPCPLQVQPIDFDHAADLIEAAYTGSRDFLATATATGGARVPMALRPHSHTAQGS